MNDQSIAPSIIAFFSVLLLILLTYSVFHLPNFMWIMPWLGTIGIFFWAVFGHKYFGYTQVVTLGLIEDIVTGSPLGFHALAFVILYRIASQQRKYLNGKPFSVIWFGYSFSMVMVYGISFLVSIILGNGVSSIAPFNWLISCLIFPVFHLALVHIRHRWVLQ